MSKNKFWKESFESYKDDEKNIIKSIQEFQEFQKNLSDCKISFQKVGGQTQYFNVLYFKDFLEVIFNAELRIDKKSFYFKFADGTDVEFKFKNKENLSDDELIYEFLKKLDIFLKELGVIHFYKFNDKQLFFTENAKISFEMIDNRF